MTTRLTWRSHPHPSGWQETPASPVWAGSVAVGIDGSQVSRAALLWAVDEAHLRRSPLEIVHVHAPQSAGKGADHQCCDDLLAEAAQAASSRRPSVAVTTQLLGGQVRDELIRLTGTAALLVLGVDRTKSPAAHGALGAIENRVAVHARCPVVLVSRPPELSAKPSGVVVGWSGSEVSQIALAAAAAEASMRRASLSVVTANPVRSLAAQSRTVPPDRADVLRAVTDIERAYPRVSVTLHYLDAEAVESLVREARPTDLMVVGSHTSADPISIRTGPVATAVMLQAPCPVMLVGQLVADTANNLAYTRPVGP